MLHSLSVTYTIAPALSLHCPSLFRPLLGLFSASTRHLKSPYLRSYRGGNSQLLRDEAPGVRTVYTRLYSYSSITLLSLSLRVTNIPKWIRNETRSDKPAVLNLFIKCATYISLYILNIIIYISIRRRYFYRLLESIKWMIYRNGGVVTTTINSG